MIIFPFFFSCNEPERFCWWEHLYKSTKQREQFWHKKIEIITPLTSDPKSTHTAIWDRKWFWIYLNLIATHTHTIYALLFSSHSQFQHAQYLRHIEKSWILSLCLGYYTQYGVSLPHHGCRGLSGRYLSDIRYLLRVPILPLVSSFIFFT